MIGGKNFTDEKFKKPMRVLSSRAASLFICLVGPGQTKKFRALLDVFIPSIYRIFRASQNTNRWRIINQMFAKSMQVDARVKNIR